MKNKKGGILFEANVEEVSVSSLTMVITDWSAKEVTNDNCQIPALHFPEPLSDWSVVIETSSTFASNKMPVLLFFISNRILKEK